MVIMILPFPLSLLLAGGTRSGQNYLVWQLFRRPNHPPDFYLTTVPAAIGILVILIALAGLWLLRHERSWREKLLIWWIIVPVVFFQVWPTKGFQYLLPIAPGFAVLAGRTLACWSLPANEIHFLRWRLSNTWVRAGRSYNPPHLAPSLPVPAAFQADAKQAYGCSKIFHKERTF